MKKDSNGEPKERETAIGPGHECVGPYGVLYPTEKKNLSDAEDGDISCEDDDDEDRDFWYRPTKTTNTTKTTKTTITTTSPDAAEKRHIMHWIRKRWREHSPETPIFLAEAYETSHENVGNGDDMQRAATRIMSERTLARKNKTIRHARYIKDDKIHI